MFNWKLSRINYRLPNRRFGKTNKDNRSARLIDIDTVIEETNTVLESIDSEVTELVNSKPTTSVVTVTSADLLAGFNPSKLILGAPPSGKIYKRIDVTVKFISNGVGYTVSALDTMYFKINGRTYNIQTAFIGQNSDAFIQFSSHMSNSHNGADFVSSPSYLNSNGIEFGVINRGAPTGGNGGYVEFHIEYKLADF